MKKYQTEFTLKVVKSFLAGEGGAKLLARTWSVPEEKIRTWVSHYRLHGIGGLRPKRSAYSAQSKLQVLSHQDRDQPNRPFASQSRYMNPMCMPFAPRSFDCWVAPASQPSPSLHRRSTSSKPVGQRRFGGRKRPLKWTAIDPGNQWPDVLPRTADIVNSLWRRSPNG
jgi:hypothetical protein